MQTLKKSSVILLMICLSGCSTPEIRDLPQMSLRLVLETDENGRRYVNEKESACFIRIYRHSKNHLGTVGRETEEDVLHCNKMIGYGPRDYADLNQFFEEVRLLWISSIKKLKKKLKGN